MKTIFLVADAYMVKTILLCCDILFSNDVDRVFVLNENYAMADTRECIGKTRILAVCDIDECVLNSDIIVVDSASIPLKTQNYIKLKAKELNKQICLCNLSDNESAEGAITSYEYKKLPVVLVLSVGNYSQSSYIELLLTKILIDFDVNFDIAPSCNTIALLEAVSSTGCANATILKNVINKSTDSDKQLHVCCMTINNIGEINDVFWIIRKMRPDFVVVSSDKDLNDYNNLRCFFQYACLSELDLIIKSHYHTAFSSYTVYCNQPIQTGHGIVDIESDHLYSILSKRLFEKLSYPRGMYPVL